MPFPSNKTKTLLSLNIGQKHKAVSRLKSQASWSLGLGKEFNFYGVIATKIPHER